MEKHYFNGSEGKSSIDSQTQEESHKVPNNNKATYCNDNEEANKYANEIYQKKNYFKQESEAKIEGDITVYGNDGSNYEVKEFLSEEIAKKIEVSSGVILQKSENGFQNYLGGGAFGEVYVAEIVRNCSSEKSQNGPS